MVSALLPHSELKRPFGFQILKLYSFFSTPKLHRQRGGASVKRGALVSPSWRASSRVSPYRRGTAAAWSGGSSWRAGEPPSSCSHCTGAGRLDGWSLSWGRNASWSGNARPRSFASCGGAWASFAEPAHHSSSRSCTRVPLAYRGRGSGSCSRGSWGIESWGEGVTCGWRWRLLLVYRGECRSLLVFSLFAVTAPLMRSRCFYNLKN